MWNTGLSTKFLGISSFDRLSSLKVQAVPFGKDENIWGSENRNYEIVSCHPITDEETRSLSYTWRDKEVVGYKFWVQKRKKHSNIDLWKLEFFFRGFLSVVTVYECWLYIGLHIQSITCINSLFITVTLLSNSIIISFCRWRAKSTWCRMQSISHRARGSLGVSHCDKFNLPPNLQPTFYHYAKDSKCAFQTIIRSSFSPERIWSLWTMRSDYFLCSQRQPTPGKQNPLPRYRAISDRAWG